jgi:hypothetical protein
MLHNRYMVCVTFDQKPIVNQMGNLQLETHTTINNNCNFIFQLNVTLSLTKILIFLVKVYMFNKVSQVKKIPLATTNSYVPFIPSSDMTITGCCRDHLLIKIK